MTIYVVNVGGCCARCGKDTFAKLLVEELNSCNNNEVIAVTLSLADALKKYVSETYHIPIEELYHQDTKEKHRPLLISEGAKKRAEDRYFWAKQLVNSFVTMRYAEEAKIKDVVLVVPDTRYISELMLPVFLRGVNDDVVQYSVYVNAPPIDLIKRLGGLEQYTKVVCDPSETSLGPDDFAETVENDASLGNFEATVKAWARGKFK